MAAANFLQPFAFTEVEQGFRRISGHRDMLHLVTTLAREQEQENSPIDPPGPTTPPTTPPKAPAEKLNT